MYCVKCGNQIPDDSEFCNKCGSKVDRSWIDRTNSFEPVKPVISAISAIAPTANASVLPPAENRGFRTIRCSNCSSSQSIVDDNREFAFCEFCGTKIVLDDYRVRQYIVDEAGIKQVEKDRAIRMRELDIIEQRAKRRIKMNKVRAVVGSLLIILAVVVFYVVFSVVKFKYEGERPLIASVAAGILFCIAIAVFSGISGPGEDEELSARTGSIKAPVLAIDGMNYEDAYRIFIAAGFLNVGCINLQDLTIGLRITINGDIKKPGNGDVESITINDRPIFPSRFYNPADKVLIYYHGKKNKE